MTIWRDLLRWTLADMGADRLPSRSECAALVLFVAAAWLLLVAA